MSSPSFPAAGLPRVKRCKISIKQLNNSHGTLRGGELCSCWTLLCVRESCLLSSGPLVADTPHRAPDGAIELMRPLTISFVLLTKQQWRPAAGFQGSGCPLCGGLAEYQHAESISFGSLLGPTLTQSLFLITIKGLLPIF